MAVHPAESLSQLLIEPSPWQCFEGACLVQSVQEQGLALFSTGCALGCPAQDEVSKLKPSFCFDLLSRCIPAHAVDPAALSLPKFFKGGGIKGKCELNQGVTAPCVDASDSKSRTSPQWVLGRKHGPSSLA